MLEYKRLAIKNPKRESTRAGSPDRWFPYYAGFSTDFVETLLESTSECPQMHVLDPWNGSGTTTACASERTDRATGIDLNPVMTMVAKGRLLGSRDAQEAAGTVARIARDSQRDQGIEVDTRDALVNEHVKVVHSEH